MTKRRRLMVVGCGIPVALLLLIAGGYWAVQPKMGHADTPEHAAVSDLPSAARDIRWFFPFGPANTYDFAIDEAGYLAWVKTHTRPTLSGPIYGRYRILACNPAVTGQHWVELTDTIAYTWEEEDRGLYLVYDRNQKRAYYQSNSR